MTIRKMELTDLACVNALCIDSFMASVAPTVTEEGIETFKNIASEGEFIHRMDADNEMIVYEESGKVVGMIELKEGRHIAMLFVLPTFQKKGIGRTLISAIMPKVRGNILTVSASLSSISAYINYGFKYSGKVRESEGLKYQPMDMSLNNEV